MKHKARVLSCLCTACAGRALAQNKISGTGTCGKADAQHVVEAGDRAGHVLVVTQVSCTWTTSMEMAGLKSTTCKVAASADSAGGHSQDRGYVVTIDRKSVV